MTTFQKDSATVDPKEKRAVIAARLAAFFKTLGRSSNLVAGDAEIQLTADVRDALSTGILNLADLEFWLARYMRLDSPEPAFFAAHRVIGRDIHLGQVFARAFVQDDHAAAREVLGRVIGDHADVGKLNTYLAEHIFPLLFVRSPQGDTFWKRFEQLLTPLMVPLDNIAESQTPEACSIRVLAGLALDYGESRASWPDISTGDLIELRLKMMELMSLVPSHVREKIMTATQDKPSNFPWYVGFLMSVRDRILYRYRPEWAKPEDSRRAMAVMALIVFAALSDRLAAEDPGPAAGRIRAEASFYLTCATRDFLDYLTDRFIRWMENKHRGLLDAPPQSFVDMSAAVLYRTPAAVRANLRKTWRDHFYHYAVVTFTPATMKNHLHAVGNKALSPDSLHTINVTAHAVQTQRAKLEFAINSAELKIFGGFIRGFESGRTEIRIPGKAPRR